MKIGGRAQSEASLPQELANVAASGAELVVVHGGGDVADANRGDPGVDRSAGRLQLGGHASLRDPRGDELVDRVNRDGRNDRARGIAHAGHVGEKQQLVGAQRTGNGSGGIIPVDVQSQPGFGVTAEG